MRQSQRDKADETRLRASYRRLILMGQCRIPLKAMKRLMGPDCAYKLYSTADGDKK